MKLVRESIVILAGAVLWAYMHAVSHAVTIAPGYASVTMQM